MKWFCTASHSSPTGELTQQSVSVHDAWQQRGSGLKPRIKDKQQAEREGTAEKRVGVKM